MGIMCYDYFIKIAWILSIQFAAISSTSSTTSTSTSSASLSTESLPIIWRTSTTTHLPELPIYLVPPSIIAKPKTKNPAPSNSNNSNTILYKHPNHNYDDEDATNKSQIQLLQDINNLVLNVNKSVVVESVLHQLRLNASDFGNSGQGHVVQSEGDKSRLKEYSDSFPILGPSNVTVGSNGDAVNDSLGKFIYHGTLMAFANNPFGNGKILGKEKGSTRKCYNNKKCYSAITATPALHSATPNNNLLGAGQLNSDSFEPLDQPPDADANTEPRYKRGVIHLYNMVSCATGCNPLIYKGYGCYCGFLGSGYAVDGIDRCCKFHDWCYDTAKCPMYLEYFIPYYWKCYHRRPICAIEHGEWGGAGSCAQRLCECDRVLSECLSRYPCPSTRAICTSSPWRLLQNAFMLL